MTLGSFDREYEPSSDDKPGLDASLADVDPKVLSPSRFCHVSPPLESGVPQPNLPISTNGGYGPAKWSIVTAHHTR